jgi:EAL domain-containing protein (putative c-di-GMP-specific phosphodiesterase class I)
MAGIRRNARRRNLVDAHSATQCSLPDRPAAYSSLYHLRNFRIGQSFIHSMGTERESAEIVAALIGPGKGLAVTAESIEDLFEEDRLPGLGCQQGQGFLFSEAVCACDASTLFALRSSPRQRKEDS